MGGGEGGEDGEEKKEKVVLMWGYLPGATPDRSPLLSPTLVRLPHSSPSDSWKDACGGGCGFAIATTVNGKIITWGSTDDLGQSYLTSGKHEETPLAFPLPKGTCIAKASAGWAHCIAITAHGEVYTWGWKECVPSGRSIADQSLGETLEKEPFEGQNGVLFEQVSPRSKVSKTGTGMVSSFDSEAGEDSTKRRRLSSAKQALESLAAGDEILSAAPCLVTLGSGVKIISVAAGGRHALALSDAGQVWGWGYGGEGQLGLGARIRIVNSPHPIPCIESSMYGRDWSRLTLKGKASFEGLALKGIGSCVKAIACGGRHSVAITDNGTLITFGWGLYGQGSTEDELSPTCVSSLRGTQIQGIAAGLWHTICTSTDGSIYAFGGNQFGQLGTGSDQLELVPKPLSSGSLEQKRAKVVSCGARHTAIMTEAGEVFCWGWNKYGQLGLGDTSDRSTPSQVPIKSYLPKNVSCGWWHTLLLVESST